LAACFAVLWGTVFPVISEAVQGSKISVGPPFFNKVNIPIGLFLLFLTGVGPLLAWRRTSLDSLKRNFGWPLVAGLVVGAMAWPLGFRNFYALVCLVLSVFVFLTIVGEFLRGALVIRSRAGVNLLSAVAQLTMRNTRRYGGYVVHFGMVLIFIGISGAAFNQDKQMEMGPGSSMEIGAYRLNLQTFTENREKNYAAERATIEVFLRGKPLMTLYPERRFFASNEMTGTMVAIYSTLKEDLYVVYAGRSPESNQPVIHAYLNPLVKWIWLGGVIVVLGTGLALLPNRQAVLAFKGAVEPGASPVTSEPVPQALLTRRGSHGSAN
jgi:cytochrome c-type biogenesis protein CcmF